MLMGHIPDADNSELKQAEDDLETELKSEGNWKQIWLIGDKMSGTLRYTYSLDGKKLGINEIRIGCGPLSAVV